MPSTADSLSQIQPKRRYDVDALRVFAFTLLIFYHVGMFYVADWDWHVKSHYVSESLQKIMLLVNPWRMPLIFLISGVAVHFLLGRLAPGAFALSRTRRLLIPLLFGMAVIVPPQAYLQALSTSSFSGNYWQFLWHYFTFQPWPPGAFDGWDTGITWNHLWYLPYLLTYTLLLALVAPLLHRPGFQRFVVGFHRLRSWQLLVLPALPFLFYELVLNDRFPTTHAYIGDWDCHAVSFTAFFLGYLLGARVELWQALGQLRWLTLVLAVLAYLWLQFLRYTIVLPDQMATITNPIVGTYNGWFWLLTVLGWGHHALNRPFRWLPYATEAVYPWYILHQTVTVVAGFHLSKLALGPVWEPLWVLVLTFAGCLLGHELIIRRSNLLRPLFGLKRLSAPSNAVNGAPAAVPPQLPR